jgi:hypothetical protein
MLKVCLTRAGACQLCRGFACTLQGRTQGSGRAGCFSSMSPPKTPTTPALSTLQDDDEEGAVYTARPFYTDGGALAPGSFDGDLEKGDPDSGSAMGTPLEGGSVCITSWMRVFLVCRFCMS